MILTSHHIDLLGLITNGILGHHLPLKTNNCTLEYYFSFLKNISGRISLGDMICKVNEFDLRNCSQAEAITYLRVSAQSGQVELTVDNSQKAR